MNNDYNVLGHIMEANTKDGSELLPTNEAKEDSILNKKYKNAII